jgi:hypothetical protein
MRDRPQVWLVVHGEELVAELLLHIDRKQARWRCSDQRPNTSLGGQPPPDPAAAAGRSLRRSLASAILALLIVAALPTAALARAPGHQSSNNWAGYALTAHPPFAAVAGRWVQPAATCDQPSPTYSAFWIGLGGFKQGSPALEQIGTAADCTATGGRRTYAWYELVPAAMVKLTLSVRPGDRLAARVAVHAQRVLLQIENLTTGRSFTRTVSMRSPDISSAEWIAEAPSECVSANQCQPLPLTDFGTVRFTNAAATTARGHVGTITDPAFTATAITLAGGGPALGPQLAGYNGASSSAIPSRLSHNGSSFTVRSKLQPTPQAPQAPPPLVAPDRLRHSRYAASVRQAHHLGIGR